MWPFKKKVYSVLESLTVEGNIEAFGDLLGQARKTLSAGEFLMVLGTAREFTRTMYQLETKGLDPDSLKSSETIIQKLVIEDLRAKGIEV